MRMRVLIALLVISAQAVADQSLISQLHSAENRYNLPRNSLVALSTTESSLNLYALNIDGAAFYPDTKHAALRIIGQVAKRPFVIRQKSRSLDHGSELYFYPTLESANTALSRLMAAESKMNPVPHPNGEYVRKLDLLNTGMCALQLNYRWQAYKQGRSASTLLDPEFCINQGAEFLSGLIRQHGFEKGVGCYYTCGNSARARNDRKEYFTRYNRHFSRLNGSNSVANR